MDTVMAHPWCPQPLYLTHRYQQQHRQHHHCQQIRERINSSPE